MPVLPDLGLLLDVDGPIASPVTRTISEPTIADSLVTLARAGVPIAFITGRSDAFIRDVVLSELFEHGLGEVLSQPHTRMFGVFEKGGSWADITADGLGEVTVDHAVVPPPAATDLVRDLVERTYADTMFFDATKRAMISVEQRVSVTTDVYVAAQSRFQDEAFRALSDLGLGLRYGEHEHHDADDATPYRIDPTVISTDIESVLLDKNFGTRRALDHFRERGSLPTRWYSVGDSRSDYLMADELFAQGFTTTHVDVRPSDGVLDREYPVAIEGDLIHDAAGAAFLRRCIAEVAH